MSNLPQFARAIEYTTARLHAQDAAQRAVVAHSLAANAAAHAASRGLATEGLGHRKLLQQAEVLAAVADFVAG